MEYFFKIMPVDYGIICDIHEEDKIVKIINKYLKNCGFRKMYKWEDKSVPPPSMPERKFRISHYYTQFMKDNPRWSFDLKPNSDLDGKMRFPENPECGWLLHTRPLYEERYTSESDFQNTKLFFEQLKQSLPYELKVLHQYVKKSEDRL